MKVYILKDVEYLGRAGRVVEVTNGYANNFLIPRKLVIKVSNKDMAFYKTVETKTKNEKKIVSSKVAMLAERIKNMYLTIKKRVHDNNKLYGSIGADEVVALLKKKDVSINKKQVEFIKTVKTIGEHKVIIRLSSKFRPELTLKVVAEKENSKITN